MTSEQSFSQCSEIIGQIQRQSIDQKTITKKPLNITISDYEYFKQLNRMLKDGFQDNLSKASEAVEEQPKSTHFLIPSSEQTSSRDGNDGKYSSVMREISKRKLKLCKDKNIIRTIIHKFYKFLSQTVGYSSTEGYLSNKLSREKTDYNKSKKINRNQFCCLQDLENVFGFQLGVKDPKARSLAARRIAYEIFQEFAVRDELEKLKNWKGKKIALQKELQKTIKNLMNLKVYKLRCRSQNLIARIQII